MRKAIIIVRVLSIISVVFFLFYPLNFFSLLFSHNKNQEFSIFGTVLWFLFTYAWFAWIVMAVAWVIQRKLPNFWPISGCITGGVSFVFVLPLVFPAMLVLPAAFLAITFCKFHLKSELTQPDQQGQSH